ncbi:MAG: PLP-dependent aminotransferase family protein, partial [Acidobacteriota bacterium]
LAPHLDDRAIAAQAAKRDLFVGPLSTYGDRPLPAALLFGYAGFPTEELKRAMKTLGQILEDAPDR